MPDEKVSQKQAMSVWSANDLLLVIDVGTTNVSKNATLKEFSDKALQNTVVHGTFRVVANTTIQGEKALFQANVSCNAIAEFRKSVVIANTTIQVANNFTPAGSGVDIGGKGTICWDANYIYVQTANNVIKRAALTTW